MIYHVNYIYIYDVLVNNVLWWNDLTLQKTIHQFRWFTFYQCKNKYFWFENCGNLPMLDVKCQKVSGAKRLPLHLDNGVYPHYIIYIYPHSTSILVAFILVNWVNHHRITFFQYPIQSPVCLVKSPTAGPMHPHVFWLNPHYILVVTPTEECVATVTPDRDEFFANDNDLICRITLGT